VRQFERELVQYRLCGCCWHQKRPAVHTQKSITPSIYSSLAFDTQIAPKCTCPVGEKRMHLEYSLPLGFKLPADLTTKRTATSTQRSYDVATSLCYKPRPVVRRYIIRARVCACVHGRARAGRARTCEGTNTGPDGRGQPAKSTLSSGKTAFACNDERESRVGLGPRRCGGLASRRQRRR
jgi:hypothetical protein